MNISLLTGIALLAAASSAAASPTAAPAPLPTTPAPAPRAELLRLKFSAGGTLYYTLIEDTDCSYREPHGKMTPIKSHLEMHLHQTTTAVRDTDGAAFVNFGIDSIIVTVDKEPLPDTGTDPAALANLATLVVLPNGKLGETQVNPDFNAGEALPGEDPAHMNPLAGLGELPPTPVQVGSVWKSPVFLGLIGEKTTADLTLTGWDTKGAASIAVIKQVLQGKFGTPPAAAAPSASGGKKGDDMKIGGWSSGTRTIHFNVEAGAVESQESVVLMTVLLTPKNADGSTDPPTRMWVKVTSKLSRATAPASKNEPGPEALGS